MKHICHTVYGPWLMSLCLILTAVTATAASAPADKTLSPYFLVRSDNPEADQLPLRATGAEVRIAGVIADVRVTQEYKNEGKRPLEAIYVFPASTRAAVYGMKMTIGERTIVAKVQEREKARQEYEAAKQAGKSASLLEQQRPNVFQMNVANIMPGDLIRVELRYTELLIPDGGTYEFVYPTVVGPRYSNLPEAEAPAAEQWVKNPYLHEGEAPPYTFDFKATISAGMPIDEASCTSHKADVRFDGPALARITLDPSEKHGGNRDLILRYRLTGGKVQTGLLLYEGEKENFFLLMMQPPKRVKSEQIPPREYIFIVDISGSMHGFPLDTAKVLLKDLIGRLRPTDLFNVLLFAGSSHVLSERSLPATSENIARALEVIGGQRGGGGTELLPAMKRALALPTEASVARTIVIATDGFVRVEREAFDLIRERLNEANMFAFGIGSGVNRYLIEGMARAGMGEPFIVTKPGEARAKADKFRRYIESPVLTGVRTDFRGFEVYDVEPPAIPDVLAERPVVVFGKWRGKPEGTVRLSGFTGGAPYSASLTVRDFKPHGANAGLRYLWARHKIALLSDYNSLDPGERQAKEITRLGLDYNLLTRYTSFVAIDTMVRNTEGQPTTVKQPLPLPQGVSDMAVGSTRSLRAGRAAPRMMLKGAPPIAAAPMPTLAPPPREAQEMVAPEPIANGDTAVADKEKAVPSVPRIQITCPAENIKFTGRVNKEHLQKVIEQHMDEIERCIRLWPKNQWAGQKLTLMLRVEIGTDGRVTSVKPVAENLTDPVVRSCMEKKVSQWRFDPPKDGEPAVAEYTLVVEPRS